MYTFESLDDDEARLTELDRDEHYATLLGKYYRHMASKAVVYNTQLDQKAAHWKFIKESALDVLAFPEEVLEALVNWKGAAAFLTQCALPRESALA